MGKFIKGQWLDGARLIEFEKQHCKESNVRFQRGIAVFRNWITVDSSAGLSGIAGFKMETVRYHLYAALNCPWPHRTLSDNCSVMYSQELCRSTHSS